MIMWSMKLTLLVGLFLGRFRINFASESEVHPSAATAVETASKHDTHSENNAHGAATGHSADAGHGANRTDPCDNSIHHCQKGIVLPVWEPQGDIHLWDRLCRALVYLVALMYMFLGSSIISDRFMASIEVITSHEREIKITRPNGQVVTKKVRVWNETVAHLALMALGSSAPEVLLSVIEIAGHDWEAGHLGPSAIVGSAAFMLYFVVGVCVLAVPKSEDRRIHRTDVFWVTFGWSIFAYIWLYLIIEVISKGVVEWWEGILTFLFFPLTVATCYLTDKKWPQKIYLKLIGDEKSFQIANEHADDDLDFNREEFIMMIKRLKDQHPDATPAEIEALAETELLKKAPKSQAFYRIQANSKMLGGGDLINRRKKDQKKDTGKKKEGVFIRFEETETTAMENVGTHYINVLCERVTKTDSVIQVDYRTEDGTANANDDYIPVSGTLAFGPKDSVKQIGVEIIDDEGFEEDEEFYVRLSHPRAILPGIKVEIETPSATVMILDNDHGGVFEFDDSKLDISETVGTAQIKINRGRGARGIAKVPYKIIAGTALPGKDFNAELSGILIFNDEENQKCIPITISNTDSYERNVDFTIELGTPWWVKTPGTDELEIDDVTGAKLAKPLEPGQADDGRPQVGEKCKTIVAIREAEEFRRAIDKLANTNATSLLIGTSSWSQQFREAVFIGEYEDGQRPSFFVYFMHFLSLPWKVVFALIPPTEMLHGWACFIASIAMIGVLTTFVGDLANHFGCTIGLKDTVTAITFVALGTSLPEVFASKVAAVMDDHADSAILHVCGGNAVNVFLGIGVAWAVAAIYHTVQGNEFRVEPGGLAFSVTLFCAGALIAIIVLQYRRYAGSIRAELGGPTLSKVWTGVLLIFLWIAYIIISGMQAYCIIPTF